MEPWRSSLFCCSLCSCTQGLLHGRRHLLRAVGAGSAASLPGESRAIPFPLEVGTEAGWLRGRWRHHSFTSWLCDPGQFLEALKPSVPSSLKWDTSASLTLVPRIIGDNVEVVSVHYNVLDVLALNSGSSRS